jgi:hypothetical protein
MSDLLTGSTSGGQVIIATDIIKINIILKVFKGLVARCHSFDLFLHLSSSLTIFIFTTRREPHNTNNRKKKTVDNENMSRLFTTKSVP